MRREFSGEASKLLSATRPPEGSHAQVEKQDDHPGGHQKEPVIGAVRPTGSHAPERGSEDNDWQEEENAGHLQPEDAANPPERAAESRRRRARLPGWSALQRGRLLSWRLRLRPSVRSRRRRSGSCFGSPAARRHPLASDPPGNPQPDSQRPPDALRSHFVMMVAAMITEP